MENRVKTPDIPQTAKMPKMPRRKSSPPPQFIDEETLLKILEDLQFFAEHDTNKRKQLYYDVTANYNYNFANDPS